MGRETRTERDLNLAFDMELAEKSEVEAFVDLGAPQDVRSQRCDRPPVYVGHRIAVTVGTLRTRLVVITGVGGGLEKTNLEGNAHERFGGTVADEHARVGTAGDKGALRGMVSEVCQGNIRVHPV